MSDPFLESGNEPPQAAKTIEAETYFGKTIQVPLAKLRHRVSVYAIIVQDSCMLMLKTHNNRYYFPGGGLDIGETLEQGLRREAREELNAEIEIGALLHADDMIYYHDPVERAVHLVRLYYACRALTQEFTFHHAQERDEILGIEWVSLREAREQDFLPSTWRVWCAVKNRLTNRPEIHGQLQGA